jgi:hypothetical protein
MRRRAAMAWASPNRQRSGFPPPRSATGVIA